ncbi:MAG: hypothetical protein FRX49_00216 [Trebouxia sp. A1-2]|nr:MAG: hypothetical protein FRX49_00216 [Trebouxia sp. A1-2]
MNVSTAPMPVSRAAICRQFHNESMPGQAQEQGNPAGQEPGRHEQPANHTATDSLLPQKKPNLVAA